MGLALNDFRRRLALQRRALRSRSSGGSSAVEEAQSFDRFADRYDRRDEFTGGWITEWLEGVLTGRSGAAAVDLGCGTGRVAEELAKHYDQVKAVDLSSSMIDIARRKRPNPRVTYEQGDLTEVTGRYDLAVSLMTLHHVPDMESALRGMSELVTPGGLVVIVDGAREPIGSRWKMLYWNLGTLIKDLAKAFEKFRLNMDRSWVEHLLSDRFLSPERFVATVEAALPGASITPISGLYTAVWQRPAAEASDAEFAGTSTARLALA